MSSAKPLIFISYAHADEPKKPRSEEIQWLSFDLAVPRIGLFWFRYASNRERCVFVGVSERLADIVSGNFAVIRRRLLARRYLKRRDCDLNLSRTARLRGGA